jgi:ribosomal protein S21
MRRLGGILARNRIKRELKLGEYYEKPSERKKRLAVERHRRRFQDLVSTCAEMYRACNLCGNDKLTDCVFTVPRCDKKYNSYKLFEVDRDEWLFGKDISVLYTCIILCA